MRIGTVATILGGKRIPAGRKLSSNDTGYIYIRVSDMKDGYVSTENLQYVPEDIFPSISKYIIHKEDVFITVAGTIGRVGKIVKCSKIVYRLCNHMVYSFDILKASQKKRKRWRWLGRKGLWK